MCGIFGYVLSATRPDARPSLDLAVRHLRHRGPDGDGTFIDDQSDPVCGLAHTRLAIIDLSAGGKQPMQSADGRFTITFNGEIYNYKDIRADLDALGERFVSNSDTEVLIVGYRRWGASVLPKLRGMFAFAIWDTVDRTLFIARDRLGVKPLYYAELREGLIFGSELRALLCTDKIKRTLSPEGVAGYLAFGSVREPRTIAQGVSMLPAGSYAFFSSGALRQETYWAPPLGIDRAISRDDAVAELGELLRQSVALRLVADVPVGVFLSGGLDSSAVVALAAAASRSPVHTFTVTFDEAAYDEAPRAKETAARFGTDHHPIHLSADRARDEMGDALAALDQPTSDGVNTYYVSKAVRQAGVTVALSGIGGDELFGGYPAFRKFRDARAILPHLSRLPLGSAARLLPFASGSARKGLALLASQGEPFRTYGALRAMFFGDDTARLLRSNARDGFAPSAFDRAIAAWTAGPNGDSIAAYGLFDLTNYLRNTLLRDTDAMGMAHALEIREPLLDHRLVERALTLPGSMKMARDRNKPLFADAVPALPRSTSAAPKMGFTLPFDTWLRGPLRGWALAILNGSDLLSLHEVQSLWSAFEQRRLSHSRVWTLIALLDWSRRHGMRFAST